MSKNKRTMVIDIGGTNVKVCLTGRKVPLKIPSGPKMTPSKMAAAVKKATADWKYDSVSIGYPGPVRDGKPAVDPKNLGGGWVRFDYRKAFGAPVKIVNDAAMQAMGGYKGGRMLFLGLGTGLGLRSWPTASFRPSSLPICRTDATRPTSSTRSGPKDSSGWARRNGPRTFTGS